MGEFTQSSTTTKVATRLIEAAIIGGVVMYGTMTRLEAKLDIQFNSLKDRIEAIGDRVHRMERDIYKPFNRHDSGLVFPPTVIDSIKGANG